MCVQRPTSTRRSRRLTILCIWSPARSSLPTSTTPSTPQILCLACWWAHGLWHSQSRSWCVLDRVRRLVPERRTVAAAHHPLTRVYCTADQQRWHKVVNDKDDTSPFTATYSPMAGVGVAFARNTTDATFWASDFGACAWCTSRGCAHCWAMPHCCCRLRRWPTFARVALVYWCLPLRATSCQQPSV